MTMTWSSPWCGFHLIWTLSQHTQSDEAVGPRCYATDRRPGDTRTGGDRAVRCGARLRPGWVPCKVDALLAATVCPEGKGDPGSIRQLHR